MPSYNGKDVITKLYHNIGGNLVVLLLLQERTMTE
jgi:hypothetical protein